MNKAIEVLSISNNSELKPFQRTKGPSDPAARVGGLPKALVRGKHVLPQALKGRRSLLLTIRNLYHAQTQNIEPQHGGTLITYFKPWPRKAGVITLSIAVLFAGAWIRSLSDQDILARMNVDDTHLLISQDGRMSWSRLWPITQPRPTRWFYRHDKNPGWEAPTEMPEGFKFHWNFSGLGFEFCATSTPVIVLGVVAWTEESVTWTIPYWSIVIPLTALSTWLLLRRPSPRKPDTAPVS